MKNYRHLLRHDPLDLANLDKIDEEFTKQPRLTDQWANRETRVNIRQLIRQLDTAYDENIGTDLYHRMQYHIPAAHIVSGDYWNLSANNGSTIQYKLEFEEP